MRLETRGNLLIITYKDYVSSDVVHAIQCCKPNRTVILRRAIIGFTANCEDESIKIILDAAEPIWLYFADSPVGDMRFEAAAALIEGFISGP